MSVSGIWYTASKLLEVNLRSRNEWIDNLVKASPKRQVLWSVPSLLCSFLCMVLRSCRPFRASTQTPVHPWKYLPKLLSLQSDQVSGERAVCVCGAMHSFIFYTAYHVQGPNFQMSGAYPRRHEAEYTLDGVHPGQLPYSAYLCAVEGNPEYPVESPPKKCLVP